MRDILDIEIPRAAFQPVYRQTSRPGSGLGVDPNANDCRRLGRSGAEVIRDVHLVARAVEGDDGYGTLVALAGALDRPIAGLLASEPIH